MLGLGLFEVSPAGLLLLSCFHNPLNHPSRCRDLQTISDLCLGFGIVFEGTHMLLRPVEGRHEPWGTWRKATHSARRAKGLSVVQDQLRAQSTVRSTRGIVTELVTLVCVLESWRLDD